MPVDELTKQYVQSVVTDLIGKVSPALPPIGSIIAYVPRPGLTLGSCWRICDGKRLEDLDSPLNGQTLPDLTDDRFLMGTADANELNTREGSNTISSDGMHTHAISGSTNWVAMGDPDGSNAGLQKDGDQRHAHQHGMNFTSGSASTEHTHGGDKRPAFYGVQWIIRIK